MGLKSAMKKINNAAFILSTITLSWSHALAETKSVNELYVSHPENHVKTLLAV